MRHVDDGTLHAWLDGEVPAADREAVATHLDACAACRARLDEARALRDRASALLQVAAPPVDRPPFERLLARAASADAADQRPDAPAASDSRARAWWLAAGWAATLLLAVGVGWAARGWIVPPGRGEAASIVAARVEPEPVTAAMPAAEPAGAPVAAREAAGVDAAANRPAPAAADSSSGAPARPGAATGGRSAVERSQAGPRMDLGQAPVVPERGAAAGDERSADGSARRDEAAVDGMRIRAPAGTAAPSSAEARAAAAAPAPGGRAGSGGQEPPLPRQAALRAGDAAAPAATQAAPPTPAAQPPSAVQPTPAGVPAPAAQPPSVAAVPPPPGLPPVAAAPPPPLGDAAGASGWLSVARTEAAVRTGMALYGLEGFDAVDTAVSSDGLRVRTRYTLASGDTVTLIQQRETPASGAGVVLDRAAGTSNAPAAPAAQPLFRGAPADPSAWTVVRDGVRVTLESSAGVPRLAELAGRLRVD